MEILLDVIRVIAKKDNTLLIEFENRKKRRFDMNPYLNKKPFAKLKNSPMFLKATVENGTVAWPGNIDIAPEILWEKSKPA
jgi:hypothetical protein